MSASQAVIPASIPTVPIARTHDLPRVPREPPAGPAPTTPDPALEPSAAPARPRSRRAPWIAGALALVAGAIAAYLYVGSRGQETTDDAQVEGRVATVATRMVGQVKRVHVDDNQPVKAGDVLVELDDADQGARLAAARADLAAAQAGLHAAQAQLALTDKQASANLAIARGGIEQAAAATGSTQALIDQAQADVVAAESRAELARTEFDRSQRLVDAGAAPHAELDARRATLEQSEAALAQAKAHVVTAVANRSNSNGTAASARGRMLAAQTAPEQVEAARAQVELAEARVAQAAATVRQAELNLGYTQVKAEVDGVVARRTVEPGQMASPERALMALVGTGSTWVVANFKETDLHHIRPGQRARVTIDGFEGSFDGVVASIQPGTGSRFSLLPPDNASGNFTKVTQRIPVRIELHDHRGLPVRPGMSAEVTVYTE